MLLLLLLLNRVFPLAPLIYCFVLRFASQEQLDKKLLERQALETGICPVREDLYTQAFGALCIGALYSCTDGFHVSSLRLLCGG